MTETQQQRTLWEKIRDFFFPPRPQDEMEMPNSGSSNAPQDGQPRYEVKDMAGQPVAQSDTLAEAHKTWQDQTDQQGSIINMQTGEDVTPKPDDNGRYVLLDQDDQQLGSFGRADKAIQAWRQQTSERGKVIDTQTGQDISAKLKGYLTDEQLEKAISLIAGHNIRGTSFEIDPELIKEMMRQLNKMDLPIYNIANIVGKGQKPGRKVPITRRKVTIELVKKKVWMDKPFTPKPTGRITVPYATDDYEPRRMRGPGDIRRVRPRYLAVPRPILNRRIAGNELPVAEFFEEEPAKPQMRKRQVFIEVEEPKVEEWTEEVEVSDDPRAQLLEIVIDVSGSMYGVNICLAIALAAVLIGKHLDDESRYLYRQFADMVGAMQYAETVRDKQRLISFLVNQKEDPDVGAGTNIKIAIDTAADDVRQRASVDDQPEILLITDGGASLSSMEIYQAILQDVILHAVNVGGQPNTSLAEKASSFYQLTWDFDKVEGSAQPYNAMDAELRRMRRQLGMR